MIDAAYQRKESIAEFITDALRRRFWSQVAKHPTGCWEWTGRIGPGGGLFHLNPYDAQRRDIQAHRVAWELTYGALSPHVAVKHFCGSLRCVRPDHLFVKHLEAEKPSLASLFFEDSPRHGKEQTFILDDEQENLLSAFSMRGYLVVLRFENMTFPVSVTTDAAQSKSAAKMVALRRARRNDGQNILGRLVSAKVVRDTDEARFEAGVDDSEYATYIERENKWYDVNLMERMRS